MAGRRGRGVPLIGRRSCFLRERKCQTGAEIPNHIVATMLHYCARACVAPRQKRRMAAVRRQSSLRQSDGVHLDVVVYRLPRYLGKNFGHLGRWVMRTGEIQHLFSHHRKIDDASCGAESQERNTSGGIKSIWADCRQLHPQSQPVEPCQARLCPANDTLPQHNHTHTPAHDK